MAERKLSLANKYRPKQFCEVSEQSSIKTILENQIKTNNIKHAYLFCRRCRYREDYYL